GVRDEGDRAIELDSAGGERARERQRHRNCARVVERRAEPAVVMPRDDRRRAVATAGEDADDVRRLGARCERRGQDDAYVRVALRPQRGSILFADRHTRWRFGVPETVEGSECFRRLVVRAPGRGSDDHRGCAAQAELEPDVVRPQPLDLPVDQRDLAGNGDAVELLPAAPADVDEATFDTVWPRLRNPTEGCALEAVTALELDERIEQTPRIDGHGLLDDVRQPGTPELISDEGGRLPFFGSP